MTSDMPVWSWTAWCARERDEPDRGHLLPPERLNQAAAYALVRTYPGCTLHACLGGRPSSTTTATTARKPSCASGPCSAQARERAHTRRADRPTLDRRTGAKSRCIGGPHTAAREAHMCSNTQRGTHVPKSSLPSSAARSHATPPRRDGRRERKPH